jgi:hypothetical protein
MEPRIPGESLTEKQESTGGMPGPPTFNLRFETVEGRAAAVDMRRTQLLEELAERRGRAYDRTMEQAEQMARRKPMIEEDLSNDGYFYKINDWVKVKNMHKNKFEFKWIGPYYVLKLGNHPRSYYLMDPKGRPMDHPVSEKNIAPWRTPLGDNQDYFYHGRKDIVDDATHPENIMKTPERDEATLRQDHVGDATEEQILSEENLQSSREFEMKRPSQTKGTIQKRTKLLPPTVTSAWKKQRGIDPLDAMQMDLSEWETYMMDEEIRAREASIIEISDEDSNHSGSVAESSSRGEMLWTTDGPFGEPSSTPRVSNPAIEVNPDEEPNPAWFAKVLEDNAHVVDTMESHETGRR